MQVLGALPSLYVSDEKCVFAPTRAATFPFTNGIAVMERDAFTPADTSASEAIVKFFFSNLCTSRNPPLDVYCTPSENPAL